MYGLYATPGFNTIRPRPNGLLTGNSRHIISMDDPRWSNNGLKKQPDTLIYKQEPIVNIYDP